MSQLCPEPLSQRDSDQLHKLAKRRTDTRGGHTSAVYCTLSKQGQLEPTETMLLGWRVFAFCEAQRALQG